MQVVLPGDAIHSAPNIEASTAHFVMLPGQTSVSDSSDQSESQQLMVAKVTGILKPKQHNNQPKLRFIAISEKYTPAQEDRVIGRITRKQMDQYEVDIRADRKALLNALNFQGASKKSRPNLTEDDIVFARVQSTPKYLLYKLTCISSSNTKAWNSGEALFGNLVGGAELIIPVFFAVYLTKNEELFELIRRHTKLEVVIGVNGVLWLKTPSAKTTLVLLGFFEAAPYMLKEKAKELLMAEIANFG